MQRAGTVVAHLSPCSHLTPLVDYTHALFSCGHTSQVRHPVSALCRQVARGKVKKGRCESIAVSKSGRVTYTGWDGDTGLIVADTYNPEAVQKKIMEHVRSGLGICALSSAVASCPHLFSHRHGLSYLTSGAHGHRLLPLGQPRRNRARIFGIRWRHQDLDAARARREGGTDGGI